MRIQSRNVLHTVLQLTSIMEQIHVVTKNLRKIIDQTCDSKPQPAVFNILQLVWIVLNCMAVDVWHSVHTYAHPPAQINLDTSYLPSTVYQVILRVIRTVKDEYYFMNMSSRCLLMPWKVKYVLRSEFMKDVVNLCAVRWRFF